MPPASALALLALTPPALALALALAPPAPALALLALLALAPPALLDPTASFFATTFSKYFHFSDKG